MSRPDNRAGSRRGARQRGIAMLLVLATLAIILVMVMTYAATQSTTLGISQAIDRHAQARQIAESGLLSTVQVLVSGDTWRTNKPSGDWVDGQSLAGGTFSIAVLDGEDLDGDGVVDGDGDLADDTGDPVTVIATGRFDGVAHTLRVVLRRINDPGAFLDRVAHWTLDEKSGTVAEDAVGDLDGAYRNGVSLGATGALPSSTGAELDGVDDRVEVGPNGDLQLTEDFALSAYVKFSSFPESGTTEPILVLEAEPASDGNTAMVEILVDSDGDILYRHMYDPGTGATTERLFNKTDLELDEWYFIVVHHNAAERQVKLHTMGQRRNNSIPWKYAAGEGPVSSGDPTLLLGGYSGSGTLSGNLHGMMDEVALFERDLTDDDIDRLKEEPAFLAGINIGEFIWIE